MRGLVVETHIAMKHEPHESRREKQDAVCIALVSPLSDVHTASLSRHAHEVIAMSEKTLTFCERWITTVALSKLSNNLLENP